MNENASQIAIHPTRHSLIKNIRNATIPNATQVYGF